MRKIFIIIYIFIQFFLVIGCATKKFELATIKVQKQFPIVLYVSNQDGGSTDSVNIVVKIDNKMIINQNFCFGTGPTISKFNFNLSEGEHRIVVESNKGNAGIDKIIMIDKKKWFSIDYVSENNFRFYISDGPIGIV